MISSVAVYCGSNAGARPRYRSAAEALGGALAESGIGLVYGGGSVGLMGAVADACIEAGGVVTGVITEALRDAEIGHTGLSRLEVVATMHDRKARMAELADGFVALPGGFGTFEELFEVVTWTQLGIHAKPVCVVDVDGFFEHLVAFVAHAGSEGFIKAHHVDLLRIARSPVECIEQLSVEVAPPTPKWADRS